MRAPEAPRFDPGSWRDRQARVLYHGRDVLRALDEQGAREWRAVSQAPSFRRLTDLGKIVRTEEVDPASGMASPDPHLTAGLLRHERVPFISYPYEWTFGMLKDAALLHLDLILELLQDGIVPKDATPYNVQWVGTRPVFIDIGSLRRLGPGEPWIGYRQFCRTFLYPLLLHASRGVGFHPWLRGSADGIDAEACRRLMRARDYLRPSVLAHVYLHAKAEARVSETAHEVADELKAAGFSTRLIERNVGSLRRLIASLAWKGPRGAWSTYAPTSIYGEEDARRKQEVVRQVIASGRWRLVWDLGSNTGTFARLAAERADYVLAVDHEEAVVDGLYRALAREGAARVLPLLVNLVDPSPRAGWRGLERLALEDRGRPDLVLALAVLHHLVISASLPVSEVLDWLASLHSHLVIEFVTRADPMVQRLLRQRDGSCDDYQQDRFERELSARFTIVDRQPLAGGDRLLYYAEPLGR